MFFVLKLLFLSYIWLLLLNLTLPLQSPLVPPYFPSLSTPFLSVLPPVLDLSVSWFKQPYTSTVNLPPRICVPSLYPI